MTILNRHLVALFGIMSCLATGCNSSLPLDSGQYSLGGNATMNSPMKQNAADPRLANQIAEARQMERSGQLTDALNRYVRLAETHPNNSLVWHRMAVTYNKIGRQDHAETCYEHALALDPMNAELLCDCGYGQFLQGDMASAEQFSRRALAINPGLQRASNNLALVLNKSGKSNRDLEKSQMAGTRFHQPTPNFEQTLQTPMDAQRQVPVVSAQDMASPLASPATMAKVTSPMPMPMPMPKIMPAHLSRPIAQPIVQAQPKPHTVSMPMAQAKPMTRPSQENAQHVSAQPKSIGLTNQPDAKTVHDKPISKAEVARLDYYAADPSAPVDPPLTVTIESASAKPKAFNQPPKALTQPMQATRLDSNDETSGVKLTLSSGTEEEEKEVVEEEVIAKEEIRTVKRSEEPKHGVVRRLGDSE